MTPPYLPGNMESGIFLTRDGGSLPYSGDFSGVNSPGVFGIDAPVIYGKGEFPGNSLELYQEQVNPHHPAYVMDLYNDSVPDIHRLQTTDIQIPGAPLSAFSEESSIISPSTTGSSPFEESRSWDTTSFNSSRKRSASECTAYPAEAFTRRRAISDAHFTIQSNATDTYDHPQVACSSYLPPSNLCGLGLPSPQSTMLPEFHSSAASSTALPDHYSSYGSSDAGHNQVYPHNQEIMSNGQTPASFKERVASQAVQEAAWKKRKNLFAKIFKCQYCDAHLTTKQNLNYHIDAHMGIRVHACKKCNKRFGTPHVRTRHEKKCRT